MDKKKLTIKICMGSSCFSRGNNETLKAIQKFISTNENSIELDLKGSLCQDCCSKGPNVKIDDQIFSGVKPETIVDIINHCLNDK